jgi:hypothetical protein
VWVAHEDRSLNGSKGVSGQSRTGTTTDSVVHNLTTLSMISVIAHLLLNIAHLAVSNEDNLSRRALLVVGGDSLDNSSGSLRSRVVVADATASTSSTTGRVDDSLRAGTWVSGLDRIDETSSGSVAVALRQGCLTSTEDIDLGAGLPLGELDRAGSGKAGEKSSCSSDLHFVFDVW